MSPYDPQPRRTPPGSWIPQAPEQGIEISTADPELDRDRDWKTLYRINTYLYHEYSRVDVVGRPFRFFYDWKAYRRWRKLGTALDVLHELSRELRAQGQLNSPTMFTPRRSSGRSADDEQP